MSDTTMTRAERRRARRESESRAVPTAEILTITLSGKARAQFRGALDAAQAQSKRHEMPRKHDVALFIFRLGLDTLAKMAEAKEAEGSLVMLAPAKAMEEVKRKVAPGGGILLGGRV